MQLSLQTNHDGKGLGIQTPTPISASRSTLTPPVTPIGKDSDVEHLIPVGATPAETASELKRSISSPLRFTDDLKVDYDSEERPIEFGRGAWSIVYKARSIPSVSTIHTPPSSPIATSRVYAVKAPLRRDARPVLQSEALTLTRLNLTSGYERYIVPFHGYHSDTEALVMTAVPLALSTYIEDQADLLRKQGPSTATMFDPVQGPDSWRDLARKLISGLEWLHKTAGIIHGDIKPHNLLLRPIPDDSSDASTLPYEPLFADFSSALDLTPDIPGQDASHTSMSAFTPPFTAPELLSLKALKSGEAVPSPASDVFSLAATLVAAATGDLLLYPGSSNMQRLAMARDGHRILEFTRCGTNGSRVPRAGFVEKLLSPAVAKDPVERIDTSDWVVMAFA
ncbi:uncharacterized protein N7484_007222 [Penicillium longicatenatum]|uniref:uncharacterized protein n=1 Tax=Penicillium longicatenatum TaxID=1561947 RepID=UPI00254989B5|nr:uncharacterized protein N7484_007222 [Penicillium longicatenatum]KAJ5639360.1 hypothetical protein N7484_007222 [Penicillium longicatenatum]